MSKPHRQTDRPAAGHAAGAFFMAFALAVLAVLATVAPEPAAAQTVTTFISNTGQTSARNASSLVQATEFTTGTGTYTLSSVGIYLCPLLPVLPPRRSRFTGTAGAIRTLLATMTNPGTFEDNAASRPRPTPR